MLDLYQSTSPNNGIILSWQEKKYTIERKTGKGGCYRKNVGEVGSLP